MVVLFAEFLGLFKTFHIKEKKNLCIAENFPYSSDTSSPPVGAVGPLVLGGGHRQACTLSVCGYVFMRAAASP